MPAGDLLVVAAVVAFAGAVQLTTGFGFALAAVPLMALAIDPHDAVIVTLAVATFSNGYQAWEGRAVADRRIALRMLAGAAVGLPIGLWIFVAADPSVLRLGIGVAVLLAVVALARGVDLREASASLDVASGVVAGALTTSVGTNGPPMVFVLQARDFSPERFRATITSVFLVLDFGSIIAFAAADEIDAGIIQAIAIALPALLAGALIGIRLRRGLDPLRFRRTVMVLLIVAAASAIASAVVSWGDDGDEGHADGVTHRTSSATAPASPV